MNGGYCIALQARKDQYYYDKYLLRKRQVFSYNSHTHYTNFKSVLKKKHKLEKRYNINFYIIFSEKGE